MGCWTHHNMWLLFIVGLQFGLLQALAPDPSCNPSTEFSCRNDTSICIPLSRLKDGTPDCADKSDEECNENEFQCQSIHQCIPRERFHDGWPDCDDGSDEECGRGQFRCRCGVPHCIEGSKVKDGTKDCEDGSDEVSGKSQNKTARCPDENRLQDLLAVEKKRRKRQIHAFGAEDETTSEDMLLNLQPSMTDSSSNNFQYSYTKFLNERLSRDGYNQQKEETVKDDKISTFTMENRQSTLSTKPFMVRTETDQYGSLNSGKIYQTAVSEPVSVFPTAESTLLKFDNLKIEKKYRLKLRNEKLKKDTENEPRRLSDLMLKIAALFQNDSETRTIPKSEMNEDLRNKSSKNMKNRKLLSVPFEELHADMKYRNKRTVPNTETEVSHIPLAHSPTVPYMPQSNVHTTGIVMSTTGTDIINGRTTEWTTVIEGTFISGTYAHIVHSTSRIYYTVETQTPSMTLEKSNPTEIQMSSSLFETEKENQQVSTTNKFKETTIEKSSRSQRINDKSLKELNTLIDNLSSSPEPQELKIKPTSTLSIEFDVTVNNELNKSNNLASSIMIENSFLTDLNDSTLTHEITVPDLKPTEVTETDTNTETADGLFRFDSSEVASENLASESEKSIDLSEDKSVAFEIKPIELNAIGRMVGNISSDVEVIHTNTLNESSSEKSTLEKTIESDEFNTSPSFPTVEKVDASLIDAENFSLSVSYVNKTEALNFEFSSTEVDLVSSTHNKDDFSILPTKSTLIEEDHITETSLRVPDVTDLLRAFMPVATESSSDETILNLETETDLKNETPIFISSSFATKSIENDKEGTILLNTFSNDKELQLNKTETVMLENSLTSNVSGSSSDEPAISESLSEKIESTTSDIISSFVLTIESSIIKDELGTIMKDEISNVASNLPHPTKASEVMVFLGIASTLDLDEITPSSTTILIPSSDINDGNNSESDEVTHVNPNPPAKDINENLKFRTSEKEFKGDSDITVLLLPSMDLNDLKNLMAASLSSSMFLPEIISMSKDFTDSEITKMTPILEDSISIDKIETIISENSNFPSIVSTSLSADSVTKKVTERAKRAVSESVTILRPEGRIVSTDARLYLTPTTLYTTYTYFTTMLIPGRGTTIQSSLHVDSIVVQPTDRAVHGIDDHIQPCIECRIHNTEVYDQYETQQVRRPIITDYHHIETVPYDAGRASEITHRTTYTYYTTRFRGGTSFVETRKETKTNVTPLSTGRYSPFEIGTYYDGDIDDFHYHTEPPLITGTRVRPGYAVTQTVRTLHPTYSQRIDPNLYKPDRVTHRTTYTYHTTRFRDGVPIVNTRKETETNVTPIPTYTRPGYRERHTVHRVAPSRRQTYYPDAIETHHPHIYQGSNPYITHRTTYTYFTTRLIGGSTHVDTRYVTETNITPNPSIPYVRGTTHAHAHPHYEDGYYETECPVCRDNQRTTVTRQVPHTRVRGRNTVVAARRSDVVEPEVKPSTATLFSTYTYATTQLTRGGRPVVRTREHTVTEVLSDVVLPTLKFGDRIRSKRTLKPEDITPKNTEHPHHVVPIRHTFSRTSSYADGRQGRRIQDTPNHRRPNRINVQHNRTPYINNVENRNKEHGSFDRNDPQALNKHDDTGIRPTNITYYSTYTYFTTELHDGTPEIKSREHTVTEILTDVIVPTVSTIRRQHMTRAYASPDKKRYRRDVKDLFEDHSVNLRKLMTVTSEDTATTSSSVVWLLKPNSILPGFEASTITLNEGESVTLTPPLDISITQISEEKPKSENTSKYIELLKTIESDTDFIPAGAEIRKVLAAKPITHYTTYTYYTTKIKPGGSRSVETSTKVSSSIIYPNPATVHNPVQHTTPPYNKKKLYVDHSPQRSHFQPNPSFQTSRNLHQNDRLYELGSQAIHQFGRPYRRQPVVEDHRLCTSCRNQFQRNQNNIRIANVQKDHYLTRVPVRNRNNVARRIPDRAPNDVYYPDSKIKPTHVTYYSTYTYFTTEPIDGSSVVRSREHTVTEVLTNVIVPTVASFNKVQATAYNGNHRRFKRETSKDLIKEILRKKFVNVHKRKLLSLDNEFLTTDDFKLKDVENVSALPYIIKESLSNIEVEESLVLKENSTHENDFLPQDNNNATSTASTMNDNLSKVVVSESDSPKENHANDSDFLLKDIDNESIVEDFAKGNLSNVQIDELYTTEANQTHESDFLSRDVKNTTFTPSILNENLSMVDVSKSDATIGNSTHVNDFLLKASENTRTISHMNEKDLSEVLVNKSSVTTESFADEKENITLNEEYFSASNANEVYKFLQGRKNLNNTTLNVNEIAYNTTEDHSGTILSIENFSPNKTDQMKDQRKGKEQISSLFSVNEEDNSDKILPSPLSDLLKITEEDSSIEDFSQSSSNRVTKSINNNSNFETSNYESNISPTTSMVFATSALNLETKSDILTYPTTSGYSEIINSVSDVVRSSFLYDNMYLNVMDTSFLPTATEALNKGLETTHDIKTRPTEIDLLHPLITTINTDESYFPSEDLEAEGAEVRHAVIATPTTHYTTYTYYSTVLKPGGKREVVTNTKVTSSTYYLSEPHYTDKQSIRSYANKPERPRTHNFSTKLHDLHQAGAINRRQYTSQNLRNFKPYNPSLATKVRRPLYKTHSEEYINHRCLTCNTGSSNYEDYYRQNRRIHHRNNNYLTSVPVRRISTNYYKAPETVPYDRNFYKSTYATDNKATRRLHPPHQRIPSPNNIPHDVPEIKPTRVTYYSTYTYFTTELQNGSPVVRSREHTVTEILTDVIVPTVASFSQARSTRYPNLRGKRDITEDFNIQNKMRKFPFQRRLLSIDDSIEDDTLEKQNGTDYSSKTVSSEIVNSISNDDMSIDSLRVSLKLDDISPTSNIASIIASEPMEVNDNFLSNAQFSKAFAAYLAFLESSGTKSENLTIEDMDFKFQKIPENSKKSLKNSNEIESNLATNSLETKTKNMMSVITSDVKKNGKITKYTTTIYGTYINGVYAQRAKSTSDVIPITEMDVSVPITTLMFSPSRLPGLVRSVVSRKIRGPVAVHLTTEIHGTFVGGAYAQTARVFTSSQPLSSTREPTKHRLQSYPTTIPSGTRKTGLLSTRILRSKVSGPTTLLFVSEIYGTHIGGAYAHLGTYTTRTIIQTTSSSSTLIDPEPTSTPLSTYYMEDLTTGLVTASVSEKTLNGITTRYHYQVYGTYLDGTYAHVPSISTETLTPRSVGTLSPSILMDSTDSIVDSKSKETETTVLNSFKTTSLSTSKIGLIHASTRAHVNNGTTTQHIFAVHGTYLNGNYAHVPSVSIITITPTKVSAISETLNKEAKINSEAKLLAITESLENIRDLNEITISERNLSDSSQPSLILLASETEKNSASELSEDIHQPDTIMSLNKANDTKTISIPLEHELDNKQKESENNNSSEFKYSSVPDFEVLTIFSDTKSEDKSSITFPTEDITIFPLNFEENPPTFEDIPDTIYEILDSSLSSSPYPSSDILGLSESKSTTIEEDDKPDTLNVFPILLPESLRLSFSHNNPNHRVKRNDPFSPYLRSSFTDSIKSQTEIQHASLVITTPLPASIFGELSKEFLENATKVYPSSKAFKNTFETKSRYKTEGNFKGKSVISKSITNSKAKSFYLKRSKRAAIRSSFGSNRRFGVSVSSSRKFGSSKPMKIDSDSASNIRSFRTSSTRNSVSSTKSLPSVRSKNIPNFLGRSQRAKPALISKSSSSFIKSTPSSSSNILQSIRNRRFGKKEPDILSKMDEDFEASEAIPRSVTEEKSDPSPTSSTRFRRPSKFSKLNIRSSASTTSSRLNKIISPTSSRRPRIQSKNIPARNRKTNDKNLDSDIRPTETIESSSSKRRFTLTTTFEINLKSTASYLTALDTDDGNNLQVENRSSKRRNKNRNSNDYNRSRQGNIYKPIFDSDDNEVKPDKPKSLPLPVFGRSRGVKRPPKFDPRTIKATPTPPTSTIIYLDSSSNDTKDIFSETELNGPITVTDVFTTVKTLPVHLGPRTSFATITTTAFTTSTIQPEDLTFLTLGGVTKTIVSAITSLPDVNMPLDKQLTVVTEIILTTTEIESSSLVAIKVGFGTRTDTVVTKQKMTTLLTQTNTILEEKTASIPFQQQYPFFPNPFAPQLPPQKADFSLSLAENSFVSTQVITSTTVLPLFFNGKTVFTTLTSTSTTEETLIKTTTFKVPQQPTMQPFIFPQPVFILPSVTTELTIQFTAHNGEIYSIVTQITVPLALNGHTRFARSITDATFTPTTSSSFSFYERTSDYAHDLVHPSINSLKNDKDLILGTVLESSFSIDEKQLSLSKPTQNLVIEGSKKNENLHLELLSTHSLKYYKIDKQSAKLSNFKYKNIDNDIEFESYNFRKLLQFDEEEIKLPDYNTISNLESIIRDPSTQSSAIKSEDDLTYVPDTFHLIGPGFNEEGLGRPIPSVRVVPTRRAYVRRLKPSGSQNLPFDGSEEEFNFRRNNQNFQPNLNAPSGAEFSPLRPAHFQDENLALRRNVPVANRPLISQDGSNGNFGTLRNIQYFSPNRPNPPPEFEGDVFSPSRLQPNFVPNRPNRPPDVSSNAGRNIPSFALNRNNRRPQSDGYDALRNLPSYTPTRQNVPQIPPREESSSNNQFGEEITRNQINRPQPAVTASPRRVIRLRRPVNSQQARPVSGRELLDRKPIINALPDGKESIIRGRGPANVRNSATIGDAEDTKLQDDSDNFKYTEPLPLTYYTTFTYMTTFLNGPSTAYSTREAIVSNIATETVNPRIVGLIRTRGGFNPSSGSQSAVPLGSRAQGATTTIVNLASRVQLYNSDIYYGKNSKLPNEMERDMIRPTVPNLRTLPITDIASLPKTYYTLFTYFYTLRDGDKSFHSQRSETVSNVDAKTEPFVLQDFASTIDSSGFLTLKPNKQIVNLGLRTAGGTTTEVNLELKTVVHFDGLKNAVIDRGSMTPTLVEIFPSETNSLLNNYLDPDDAEVQDQQTYPQTVPIQPSFSSVNEVYAGTQRSSSSRDATPEIPSGNRIVRTQSIRGPLRVASTVLQRPGSLRSGVFAPRPGVRVRVRPVSSRITTTENPILTSSEPDLSSYTISFDPSRTISEEEHDFDDEDTDVTEEDNSADDYTTEDSKSTEEEEKKRQPLPGRKRLKITIRRSPGVSASKTTSAFIRPTRTRPRFYVVTRTASPTGGPVRQPKRPVSVKVSRRLRPSGEPEYETYTTMTSVPVVFGLSTTYRNALVTSSSLITSEEQPDQPEPSKTVVLTYFTTTTYTVPYTVDGVATYTTLEETNSRIATETLDPDADLSFISTTTIDYADEISASSSDLVRHPPQTLKPQLVNNQLNVGPRINLATKISNGVTLIVASDGENEATQVISQPAVTLQPTVVTDALHMTNQFITTLYEPRTFYTTFTFFTTFFSSGTPSTSTSEQVITNVYSVPVTHSLTKTQPATEPLTVVETSQLLVSSTIYTTHTFYATLFNGTSTVVTPIEELQSSVVSTYELYTITKTIMPDSSEIQPTVTMQPSLTTTSVYRTRTNFVTLFRGTESIVSPLEEIETDIVTLTLDNRIEPSSLLPKETYTTRTIQATNTHYITLFSGSESILSSITEVAPSVITELVKQLQEPTTTPFIEPISIKPTAVESSSSSSIEPIFQDLVPSIRTQYTTLTYFTTLFTDSSTILSSREEIATSYITLFVPAPAPGATSVNNAGIFTSQIEKSSHGQGSKPTDIKSASVTPTSEILTFYTTYTYYTTLFRGTETIISDSETVVTQYVTIESTPTDSTSRHTTSLPPTFSRPNYSDTFEIRTEPSPSPTTATSTFSKESSKSKVTSDDDLQIIGVSTKIESASETPSIITGIPSTDANGATHILFTDFIVPSSIDEPPSLSTELFSEYVTPSLPDLASTSSILTEPSSVSFDETTFFSQESSTPSSARESAASDLPTTRVTDVNVATHHMVLHPTTTYQSGTSQTMGLKPGAVIDLSDVLTNTNLVGNLGETIKDIVNLFAANGNRAGKNSTSKSSQISSDTSVVLPSGGITISSAEDPVFIPIGAIARSTKVESSPAEKNTDVKPSTMLSGFTPLVTDESKLAKDVNNRKVDSVSSVDLASDTLTSIIFGSNTIFIQPTAVKPDTATTILFSEVDGRFHNTFDSNILHGSESSQDTSEQQATPSIKQDESTTLITGLETIFFGFPDARQPPQVTTQVIQGSGSTSSIVGFETIFFDSPKDFFVPGSNQVNITGATTIFGTFPILTETSTSSTSTPQSTFTSTSSGETTIFFPVPGDNQQQNPGTRYVTSVESVTLTLTLTTSSVYQTEDTPVTVTSVFTTTIPPRTFVSTIIGDRTILGTQPEPTEAVQVIPTIQPSESTTTVTTTTLIFNSIATTVVRTLVIPTNAIQPTKPSASDATDTVKLGGVGIQPNERSKPTTERPRRPIQLFKSGNRPTEPTTPKPLRTGPPLKLFPTKPPTTTTLKPPPRPVTTRKTSFRKPGKTLVPITDGCLRECNLKNKEVCKQNVDKTWSCQCRPGFFKKNGSEECRDVKSFVVLVRVLKMGDNEVIYSPDLSNHLSPEYKNLTTTARKAVDDAYKISSVGDDFVSTNVISVARDRGLKPEGVLVNLTVQLSGEKPANEEFLKEELANSLEAASSDISLSNASVSPIIQRVEDVQDFDECYDDSYNDCSRSAICVNLPGTYTCECKDGYQDLEPLLPGRICSGEIKDCDYCNNRGVCIMTEDDNKFCRCYRMYLGKQCEINGLVLAIALPIALALLILTMFCLLCGCRKLRQRKAQKPKQNVFKGMAPPMAGTLDRKAMIMDSSSESSGEHRPPAHAYDGFSDDVANSTMKRSRRSDNMMDDQFSTEFQVPTVLIPRAKHSHPKQVNAPYPNYRMPHGDMDRW